ncbi:MAG: hypothetical protein AAGE98_05455 [Actinomycetota bacterium]
MPKRLLPTVLALLVFLGANSALLAACGGGVSNELTVQCSDPDSADNLDTDGDGYTPCQGDCDDADPNAYPGGVEESDNDGYDQDCSTFTFVKE